MACPARAASGAVVVRVWKVASVSSSRGCAAVQIDWASAVLVRDRTCGVSESSTHDASCSAAASRSSQARTSDLRTATLEQEPRHGAEHDEREQQPRPPGRAARRTLPSERPRASASGLARGRGGCGGRGLCHGRRPGLGLRPGLRLGPPSGSPSGSSRRLGLRLGLPSSSRSPQGVVGTVAVGSASVGAVRDGPSRRHRRQGRARQADAGLRRRQRDGPAPGARRQHRKNEEGGDQGMPARLMHDSPRRTPCGGVTRRG